MAEIIRTFVLCGILTMIASASLAQSPCEMTLADLPETRGIRLGMSRANFGKRFIGAAAIVEKQNAVDKVDFESLEAISVDFYRDLLFDVEFDFDRSTRWKNIREFAESLKESHGLPMESWVFVGHTEAMMKCQGFTAAISSVRNTLSLTDTFSRTAAKQNAANIAAGRKRIYAP